MTTSVIAAPYGFLAVCSCGWAGPVRVSNRFAVRDAEWHRAQHWRDDANARRDV